MALSAARASLRDEAPEGAPSPCETMVRRNRQKPCAHVVICCIGESPSFIKERFGADSNTSRTPERRRATYSRPRIGVRSHTGRVRPSPRTRRGSGPALYACETPPGESIGLRRSSTGCERVAGFGYRSLWWRVRGVRRPGVSKSLLSRQRRTPEAGTATCHWGPGAHPPS